MSIETLLAANIKATEELTATMKALPAAIAAGVGGLAPETKGKKTKPDTPATTAADPAATSGAAPAGTAAGSAAGAATTGAATTGAATTGALLDPKSPLAVAVTDFARVHGKDAARAAVDKFGGAGRASNIKEIDREAALKHIKAEHVRLDAAKAAAAAAAQPEGGDSLI